MTRIRWWADRLGIAHAHVSGRTLCHAPSIAERDAWPMVRRCARCVTVVKEAPPTRGYPQPEASPSLPVARQACSAVVPVHERFGPR
jgi:hypothetical protein